MPNLNEVVGSSLSTSSSSPTTEVYCVLAEQDHNQAFTSDGIYTQCAEQLGLQVINYTAKTYEDAINYADGRTFHIVHERRHGDAHSGTLSDAPGGSISTSAQDQETVNKVCRLVAPGGIYLVEGCLTGLGKENLLKHLARSCLPGTRLIGAKASKLYLDPPEDKNLYMSNYLRFYSSGYGVTRYYYHTQSGKIQNIPEEELFSLWQILKPEQTDAKLCEQAFDLCFTLLAERHDPATFRQVCKDNRELIVQLIRDPERVITFFTELRATKEWKKEEMKPVWQQMLTDLEDRCQEIKYPEGFDEEGYPHDQAFCIPYSKDTSLYMPRKEVSGTTFENAKGTIRTISDPGHPYAKAYLFLLGCALIDRSKVIFMLLDNQSAGNNPATRAIHALSDLAIHGNGNKYQTVYTILATDLQLIKASYRIAKEHEMLSHWYVALSKGVCFDDYIERARTFYHERLTVDMHHRLRNAVLNDEANQFYALSSNNLNHFDANGCKLFDFAIKHRKIRAANAIASAIGLPPLNETYSHEQLSTFSDAQKQSVAIGCLSVFLTNDLLDEDDHNGQMKKAQEIVGMIGDEELKAQTLEHISYICIKAHLPALALKIAHQITVSINKDNALIEIIYHFIANKQLDQAMNIFNELSHENSEITEKLITELFLQGHPEKAQELMEKMAHKDDAKWKIFKNIAGNLKRKKKINHTLDVIRRISDNNLRANYLHRALYNVHKYLKASNQEPLLMAALCQFSDEDYEKMPNALNMIDAIAVVKAFIAQGEISKAKALVLGVRKHESSSSYLGEMCQEFRAHNQVEIAVEIARLAKEKKDRNELLALILTEVTTLQKKSPDSLKKALDQIPIDELIDAFRERERTASWNNRLLSMDLMCITKEVSERDIDTAIDFADAFDNYIIYGDFKDDMYEEICAQLILKNKCKQAFNLTKKMQNDYRIKGVYNMLFNCYEKLAAAHIKQRKFTGALKYIKSARYIRKQFQDEIDRDQAAKIISYVYVHLQQPNEAFKMCKKIANSFLRSQAEANIKKEIESLNKLNPRL